MHTLCLLDIKMKEQSIDNLLRGNKIYEPPRFMTINTCIEQLLEVEEKRQQNAYTKDTICVGLARIGQESQKLVSGKMKELLNVDFGTPLHCFIITGTLHIVEKEYLDTFCVTLRPDNTEQKEEIKH